MFELIERKGHSKKTIAKGDNLEDIAEIAAKKSGIDPRFEEPEDFIGGFEDG